MKLRTPSTAAALILCAAAAVPVTITTRARAADDTMIQMARERFQEGVKYYDEKQYEKARAAFLQAYALKRHPAVLLNLAQSELRSGHEADAAKHFVTYLREHKEASALERQEAEKGLQAAKAKVGEITLNVDVDGAEIFVDGQPEGRSPLSGPIYLEPGQHSIEARREGKAGSTNVTAKAGVAANASVTLGSTGGGAAAPAPAPSGGGEPSEEGTEEPRPAGGAPAEADEGVSVDAQADTGGREPFISWASHTPVAWVGGGLTVIGLGAGLGFAIGASMAYSDANDVASSIRKAADEDRVRNPTWTVNPCVAPASNPSRPEKYVEACNLYTDNKDKAETQERLSLISFIVAGAAATGTVVYYFIDAKPEASARTSRPVVRRAELVPVLSPQFQGFSVLGNF
jgi:hypothetical protein